MTTFALPGNGGAQEPRVSSWPAYGSSAGQEAVGLASLAGLQLDTWQQFVLQHAMGEWSGKWAAFEVCMIVPRQNGKGSVLEALELAALFLADDAAPPPLILHSAHEFKTSAEHFRRMRDLVERNDSLAAQVRIIRTAAGAESIELHSGARLRFVTRTGGSGRGFSADLIVIDEAYNLAAESMAAVLPTLSARPNPQVWYTSSAGMQASEQLARLRERGLKGSDPSLAFFEWSAEDGADLDDRAAWAQANPALGLRIPEEFVARERAALPDEQFGRERLGLWAARDLDSAAFPVDVWRQLADPTVERGGGRRVFAVATDPDREWSAVAVAWKRPDGLRQVEVADYRSGTDWVAGRVAELRRRWGGTVVADTPSRALGLDAQELSQGAQYRAHNALADAVQARTVRHDADKALDVSVRACRWRPTGDTRKLDRKGTADISPLIAVALAYDGLNAAPGGGWMVGLP